ncbi:MAG: LamG domain-containing protein [Phycisphaerae bacterium]|nr:LamG domain-containing protein [Phycisphaerae bacterium]
MCRGPIYLTSFVLVLSLVSSASPDLVAYWPLNGDAIDVAGNHHGTLVGGASFVNDTSRSIVLSVDGVDGHVEVPHDDDMVFSSADSYTIMAWIYVEALPGSWQAIMAKSRDQGNHYGIWITDSGEWMGGGWENRGSPAVTHVWVHIAYVQDGAAGTGVTYIDGAVDWSGGPRDGTGAGDFWIGGARSVTEFLRGMIDEVRVYNHAMTEEEIQTVMLTGGEGYPYSSGPVPKDGTLHADTWINLSWWAGDFTVSHDVYLGDNFDDVNDGAEGVFRGNQAETSLVVGFPGFPYPEGLVPGTTYYWRIDEVNEADPNSPWNGDVWSFSIPPKTAYSPVPADAAESVPLDVELSWTGGFGAKLHNVYLGTNFDDVNNAAGGVPLGSASYSPGTLESEKVYYWRVDEFDPPFTHKGDIWSFTTPGAVGNPQPANGAVDVQMIATLSWTAADNATSHELYFGADGEAVKNATTASPEYVGPKALGSESYDPGKLAWDAAYYWRVDEVYPAETVKGLLWGFATADFILVDDFESYNDIDPPDDASNRIFDKWIDGFGTTTNGALVGNDLPPYAEQTTVHGGAQSMPYFYDNANKTSEATLTLVYPRDWTAEGVTKLSLWVRGSSANAADRIFVALNGTAVVYHDDASATQLSGWKEWVIDLATFGVDLTNVNSISIGVGTKNAPAAGGGPGTMYFDDIRLVR